ncbi:MAG: prepilin-type N-terminal cleavage/methylation domain-containing protein [Alphaproteobacteria bacterium]
MIVHPGDRNGFTLVELSIVLVIIGLLVGGILGGQSLLRSSQLRGVMTDLTTYATAVQSFRSEFHNLPGDMPNATQYWGVVSGYTTGLEAGCYTTNKAGGTATCNGDGSGQINYATPGGNTGTEDYLAWQHLANAGLITGSYSGMTAVAGSMATVGGTNAPAGKIDGMTYVLYSVNNCAASSAYWTDGCYGTQVYFGGNNLTTIWPAAILTPSEMYSIDKKLDDGLPGFGQLRTWQASFYPNCIIDTSNYNLGYDNMVCAGMYGVDPIR